MNERTHKVGDRFGSWTLLRVLPPRGSNSIWSVICDCGHHATVYASNLTRGTSNGCQSCGAKRRQQRERRERREGQV